MQLLVVLAALVHVSQPPLTRVEFVRMPERLVVGQQVQLSARVLSDDGTVLDGESIAWRAASSSYVSLATDGRITGVRPGRVEIMAIAGSSTATSTIEVIANDVSSLSLLPSYTLARVGDAVSLRLDVRDGDGVSVTGLLAEWTVTPDGGVINDDGLFVANRTGLFTVLATIGDRKVVATVRVAPPTSRHLAPTIEGLSAALAAFDVRQAPLLRVSRVSRGTHTPRRPEALLPI